MNIFHSTIIFKSLICITLLTINTTAVKTESVKDRMIRQIQLFQPVSFQQGKTLKKAAFGSNENSVTDSIEIYRWESSSWAKDGCTRYLFDSNGRLIQQLISNESFDEKVMYEYDPDGVTMKELSIWSSDFSGPDTMIAEMKYYPGYSNLVTILTMADMSMQYIDATNGIFNFDSIISIGLYRNDDGEIDTSSKSIDRYVKDGDRVVRSNATVYSLGEEPVNYSTDYCFSGNGVLDTLQCKMHFDMQPDDELFEELSKMQYLMLVTRTDQQNKMVEQTIGTGSDSSFSEINEETRMYCYYNASGNVDSIVEQEWDTVQQSWSNIEKTVYSYKNMSGIKRNISYKQTSQVALEVRNGILKVAVPDGVTVNVVEQLDLQGKVISKIPVTGMQKSSILCSHINMAGMVSFIRLKTDKGIFIGKITFF